MLHRKKTAFGGVCLLFTALLFSPAVACAQGESGPNLRNMNQTQMNIDLKKLKLQELELDNKIAEAQVEAKMNQALLEGKDPTSVLEGSKAGAQKNGSPENPNTDPTPFRIISIRGTSGSEQAELVDRAGNYYRVSKGYKLPDDYTVTELGRQGVAVRKSKGKPFYLPFQSKRSSAPIMTMQNGKKTDSGRVF